MKFLFVSETGDGMGLALRVQEEGNEVAMLIKDSRAHQIGDGLVPKVEDWKFQPDRETVIVADTTGNGVLMDMLRAGGYPTVAGSLLADRLEEDRQYAREVFKACGIRTPKAKTFHDWESGKEFVGQYEGKLCFKPCGILAGNLPSYVSSGPEDLLHMMEFYSRKVAGQPEFELQEFLEGIDISTEAWFDGARFLRPFNHTLEQKHLMNENLGPSGGCSGNVLWACEDEISAESVEKFEDFLRENQYVGPIDINAIVNDDGLFGLEFTPRFGYDASPTLFYELLRGELGKFLSDVARGQADSMPVGEGFCGGVKLTVSPWPAENFEAPEGLAVRGLRGKDYGHFYPYNLMLDGEDLVTCGAYGLVGVACGYGDTLEASMTEAYKLAKRIKVPEMQYRTDLTEEFQRDLRKLTRMMEVEV